MDHWKNFAVRMLAALRQAAQPDTVEHVSRRPCPNCGGPMTYRRTRWTAITRKHLRSCTACGYCDVHPVRMIKQL